MSNNGFSAGIAIAGLMLSIVAMMIGLVSYSANAPLYVTCPTGQVLLSSSTCGAPTITSRIANDLALSSAQGVIVQQNTCSATSGTSFPCAFSSNIVAGHDLMVCGGSDAAAFFDPTDSQLNAFAPIIAASNTANVKCWSAAIVNAGADTITFRTSTACANCGFYISETSGTMELNILSATGTGTSTSYAVSALGFVQHPVFVSCVASTTSQGTFTPGANFVIAATGNTRVNCETSVSGLGGGSTTCPSSGNSVVFADVCVAVQAESGLFSISLSANTVYSFTAYLYGNAGSGATLQYGIHTLAVGASVVILGCSTATTNSGVYSNNYRNTNYQDASICLANISYTPVTTITGVISVGSTPTTLTIDFANPAQVGAGTARVRAGSMIEVLTGV